MVASWPYPDLALLQVAGTPPALGPQLPQHISQRRQQQGARTQDVSLLYTMPVHSGNLDAGLNRPNTEKLKN